MSHNAIYIVGMVAAFLVGFISKIEVTITPAHRIADALADAYEMGLDARPSCGCASARDAAEE